MHHRSLPTRKARNRNIERIKYKWRYVASVRGLLLHLVARVTMVTMVTECYHGYRGQSVTMVTIVTMVTECI